MTSSSTCFPGALIAFLLLFFSLPSGLDAQNPGEWFRQTSSGDRTERRHESAFVQIGEKFYLMGGRYTRTIQEYDPVTGVVRNMNTKTNDIHHFQAVEWNGKAYIIGAMTGTYPTEDAVPNVLIYDPVADRMITGATIPAARRRGGGGTILWRNRFYFVGGNRNGHSAFLDDGVTPAHVPWLDAYDPRTDTWTILPDAPHARDHFFAAEKNGKLYVAAGRRTSVGTSAGTFGDTEAGVDVYDLRSRTWATGSAIPDDLPTERAAAPVAILGNELIVMGGVVGSNPPDDASLAVVEAMDLATGEWRRLDDMKLGRHGTQALVWRGDIWVGAGAQFHSNGEIPAGADFFEAFSFNGPPGQEVEYHDWEVIGNAISPRSESNTLIYKGEMYCFFGFDMFTTIQPSAAKYDPVTNTFTELARIPDAADGSQTPTHYGLALVDDVAWLIGGRLGTHPGPVTDRVRLYNFTTDSWSEGPRLPFKAGGGGAARLGNKIHYVGGFDDEAECDENTHLVWDLDAPELGWQDWTSRSPMPMARNHFGAVALGGKLYTLGGQYGHDGCQVGQNLSVAHVYDPVTDSWTRLPDLLRRDSHMEAGSFTMDGKIYLFGGQSQGAIVDRYDPVTNRWEILSDFELPEPLLGVNARIFGDEVYVAHGGAPDVRFPTYPVQVKTIQRSPLRELRFHPGALNISLNSGETGELEAILANMNGEHEADFAINAGAMPGWLSSDRTSGTAIQSATELNLTVNAAGLSAGTYSFTVTASAPDYAPASLPVILTVTGSPPPNGAFSTYLEAECAAVGANWRTLGNAGAAGGQFVEINPGLNSGGSAPADVAANRIRFTVDVPASGNHFLHARIKAPSNRDDSFWVRVDGGNWIRWWSGLRTGNNFGWREVLGSPFALAAGTRTIDFAYREDGTQLDRIMLSTEPTAPAGVGSSASNCGGGGAQTEFVLEAECATVGANWDVRNSFTASGRSFVAVRPGLNALGSSPGNAAENRVSFNVNIEEAAAYHLLARVKAETGNDDSFWVRVDNGPWIRWWQGLRTDGDFAWREVAGGPFSLALGAHRIDIAYREDGALLDKIVLRPDAALPSGFGPAAQNCSGANLASRPTSGFTDPAETPALSAFPNPATDLLSVTLNAFTGETAHGVVFDALGRPVRDLQLSVGVVNRVRLTGLRAGSYYLRVSGDAGELVQQPFLIR